MARIMEALRRLVNNPKTAKFARSLSYNDLPADWANDPEIVQLAADVYKEQGTRSPFFKAWFGDWEAKQAADYAMNGNPVVRLTGKELPDDGVKITEKVPSWYKLKYNGRVDNPELGEVLLNKRGVKDSMTHGMRRNEAFGFAAVPEIVKEGKIFDRQPNWKGRSWDSYVMAAPVEVAGRPHIGEVIARSRGDGGQKLYVHNIEDKTVVEPLLDPFSPKNGVGAVQPLYKSILAQKADNVKRTSKVVGNEGNPLIVHHGTGQNLDEFDMAQARQNMDIQGAFFAADPREAQEYGDNIYDVYLNLKNPADDKTSFKALDRSQNKAGVKAREKLMAAGYDGVNRDGEEFIAFSPTQIKSIHNRGTFNPDDPNIYKGLIPLIGAGGAAAALAPGQVQAAIPAEQYVWRADRPGYVNPEKPLGTPVFDPADVITGGVGVAGTGAKMLASAATPFVNYATDKAINGLLGLFQGKDQSSGGGW